MTNVTAVSCAMQVSFIWSNYTKQKALTVFQRQLLATEFSVYSKLTYVNHHKPWNQNTNSVCSLALSYVQNVPFSSWRKHKDGCAIASLQYQWYVDQHCQNICPQSSSTSLTWRLHKFVITCIEISLGFRVPKTTIIIITLLTCELALRDF